MKKVIKSSISDLKEQQAEIAARAYELYVDDIDGMGYDTSDINEVQLDVSEAIIEAVDEFGFNSPLPVDMHEKLLKVLIRRLRLDGVISA